MTPTNLAAALIAARIAQAQIAVAARLMRHPEGSDATVVQQLVAAATLNGEKLSAAVQRGIGELVDFTA